jgi:hypothetical protein
MTVDIPYVSALFSNFAGLVMFFGMFIGLCVFLIGVIVYFSNYSHSPKVLIDGILMIVIFGLIWTLLFPGAPIPSLQLPPPSI